MRILGEPIDLGWNAARLWRCERAYLCLLLATALLDAASTTAFMSSLGVDRELNPLVRGLSAFCGIVIGPLLGKIGQLIGAVALCLLAPRLGRFTLSVAILLNLLALVVNLHVYQLGGPVVGP
ncbi:MAG TPA: hypothetical protein DCY13_23680 [Verrucomicrobiales bacterium]|nr:hypothetical protein [Verrucomicrobiales bacterium]